MNLKSIEITSRKMADFTNKICQSSCDNLGSCCSVEYCEIAISDGLQDGVEYKPTGDKLPMFDPVKKVCIAAPHHRLMCTIHHCEIDAVGLLKGKPAETKMYFMLREKMNEAYAATLGLTDEN